MKRHPFFVWFLSFAAAMTLSTALAEDKQPAGQATIAPGKPAINSSLTVIELTIHPAMQPWPALKYRLLPDVLERTPGSAVPIYMKAMQLYSTKDKSADKIDGWLDVPLKDLPLAEVRSTLAQYAFVLREVEIATRREKCEWDPPIAEESQNIFGLLLPEVQQMRALGRLVALRARLQIAEKKYDDAIDSLRTGYSMASQVSDQPFLISSLVGVAIAATMTNQLETLEGQSDAPNLYWAIASLPHPFIDMGKAYEMEGIVLYQMFPEMKPARRKEMTSEQWDAAAATIYKKFAELAPMIDNTNEKTSVLKGAAAAGFLLLQAPQARADLIAAGHSKAEVEAMSIQHAVLLDMFELYEADRDDMFKWCNMPYWQSVEGMTKVESRLKNPGDLSRQALAALPRLLLPAVKNVALAQARIDRQLAASRVIEAIRLHAASHDDKLPATLEDIQEVPVPINPVTGKAFGYKVEGHTAILDADGGTTQQQFRLKLRGVRQ